MTTQVSTKVRLVRCPKCRQLLAELPDVSLYQCGGCGTVLQAKKRIQEMSCTESSSQGTHFVARSQQDNASVEKEAGSSNRGSTRLHSIESSPDKGSCCNNCDEELSEGSSRSSVSNGHSSAVQITSSRSEEVQESLKPENASSVEKEGGSFIDGSTRLSSVETLPGKDSCHTNNHDELSDGSSRSSVSNGPSSSVQIASFRSEGVQESSKPDELLAQISEGEGSDASIGSSTSVQITISWNGELEESLKPDNALAQSSEGEGSGVPNGSSSPAQVTSSRNKEVQECLNLDEPLAHNSVGEGNSVSNGSSGSVQATISQSKDTAMGVEESLKQDNLVGQNSEGYNSKSLDDNGKWSGGSSNGIPSSGEVTCGADLDVPEVHEYGQGGKDEDDFSDEIQNLPELEDEGTVLAQDSEDRDVNEHGHVLPQDDGRSCNSSINQDGDCHGGLSLAPLGSDSGVISPENTNVPQPAEQSGDRDDLYASGKGHEEKHTNGSDRDPAVAYQRSLNESLASFYFTCPDDEPVDHSPREVSRKYGRFSSIDTFGSSSLAELGSELNFKYGSVAKYPPASSYYADDGSESSYDGTDDQIHERVPLRNRKDANYTSAEEMLRKENFLGSSEPERSYWATSSSHWAAKGGHRGLDKSTEINGYASGNSLRPKKSGDVSRLRPMPRDTVAIHRTMSPGYQHDLLPPHPGFNSSDTGSYVDAEKRDLLRKVFELKDQLSRMQLPKVPAHRRFPPGARDGKYSPFHYDNLSPEQEIYAGLNHHGAYHLRRDLGQGCAEGCSISRPAFSGEAVHYRHRLGCACLHCHPQDWHYSAQLPCKTGFHAVHTDHNLISGGMSPQHYTSSELSLWGCETMSSNQRLDEMKRLRLKEKYQTVKKCLLPVASGAPFIACYHCYELLQLPADFLILKRRYHQLRCNGCRKILKFSLLKGTQLVPLLPDESAPPNSVADAYQGAARSTNLEQMSHSSSCQHGEAMSYSDNGQSFCRSCSTEGEASAISSLAKQIGRSHYNRKMSSGSSFEPLEDRKMKSILREDPSTNGTRAVKLVGPSSQKRTSEIEEVLPSNSPLHQLMGYSSPSQVF